jgi:DNA-directed RNA polymerase specialized sigma24 family protein
MKLKSESDDIDPKIIVEVYNDVVSNYKKASRAQGRGTDDAYEVAQETVTRLLESHKKEPIREPLRWARHTAKNLWTDLQRRDQKHLSYDGVKGLSLTEGLTEPIVSGANEEEHNKADNMGKRPLPLEVRVEMVDLVTETRDPATLAEQRDFIQKIDTEWEKHITEGFDFCRGGKMDRNTRRQIQRRARALLREGPLC